MSKHTPRPWGLTGKGTIRSHNGRGSLIAKVHWVNRDADSHLILAAPDLLDALKNFVAMGETYGWDGAATGRQYLMQDARAAIAKAEGDDDAAR